MSDPFNFSVGKPVKTELPRPPSQLAQLQRALEAAQSHLAVLRGKHAHNRLAIGIQEKIILQYETRIAELTQEDDSWLTN